MKSAYSFISARDFLEKKIFFREGKKYYHYFSSAPDTFKEPKEGVVRGY